MGRFFFDHREACGKKWYTAWLPSRRNEAKEDVPSPVDHLVPEEEEEPKVNRKRSIEKTNGFEPKLGPRNKLRLTLR